jgi:hypothetical protein
MPHYHIHWSTREVLDWEAFKSKAEAEAAAQMLVRRGETYVIEERDERCPRCQSAFKLKTAHKTDSEAATKLKYPWQQAVLGAFSECRPEFVPWKVNLAQRAIAARLADNTPADNEEKVAIHEALHSLKALLPERRQKEESREKKATA